MAAQRPGELLGLDTFYIGKLKGVGKIWQYTACHAACSHAIAHVTTESSATAAAHFLTTRALPAYRAAGWAVARVVTDQGNLYLGAFDQIYQQQRIRQTRPRPVASWNGCREQSSPNCGASSFRGFLTSAAQLQVALDRYLGFYNYSVRTWGIVRGSPSAKIFWRSSWGGHRDQLTCA